MIEQTISPYAHGLTEERKHEHNMKVGSRMLLCALWASHPAIMRHLGARRP